MKYNLPSALDNIYLFSNKIRCARSIICFDYDGTLSPIVSKPELALLPENTKKALFRLSELTNIAVLSGRELTDVTKLVDLPSIYYGGSHGFELKNPDGDIEEIPKADEFLPVLANSFKELQVMLNSLSGIFIERKKFTIAIHYRLLKDTAMLPSLRISLDNFIKRYPQLRITEGKKVYELKPAIDWDKGKALLHIINKIFGNKNSVFPIFLGDDLTDEDAFKVIKNWGAGILVGTHEYPTSAEYLLNDTDEVFTFITALINNLKD